MQTMFGKHIKNNPPLESEVYELKISKGNSLPFDSVQEHQIIALVNAENDGLYHKITDPPIFYGGKMRFNVPRPFDCMFLIKAKAFIILWFYHERQKKVFIKIPISIFLKEKNLSERKSLTEQRALEIGKPFLLNYPKQ